MDQINRYMYFSLPPSLSLSLPLAGFKIKKAMNSGENICDDFHKRHVAQQDNYRTIRTNLVVAEQKYLFSENFDQKYAEILNLWYGNLSVVRLKSFCRLHTVHIILYILYIFATSTIFILPLTPPSTLSLSLPHALSLSFPLPPSPSLSLSLPLPPSPSLTPPLSLYLLSHPHPPSLTLSLPRPFNVSVHESRAMCHLGMMHEQ